MNQLETTDFGGFDVGVLDGLSVEDILWGYLVVLHRIYPVQRLTEETRKKISLGTRAYLARAGSRKHTEETKSKMRAAWRERLRHKPKK